MPTVVHHDRPVVTETTGSGAGALASVVAIVVLAILFFLYALPALRSNDTNINVPDRINIQTEGQ